MSPILTSICMYFFIINTWLFILMWSDKRKSRKDNWRIKEKTLWSIALIGGSIGGWTGMKVFRHKTRRRSFIFGFPALAFLQLMVLWYIVVRF